jgi:DNA end-binding protein Ku
MPEGKAAPSARPIWSGTISFGLVSIPVQLLPAVREGRVSLRMLDEDGTPLSRRYYCPNENREVHPEHLLRGYEVDQEKYIVLRDEELEALAPEKSRDIDLRRFVNASEINPMYFDRSYFLMPGKESNKAYRLLAETMETTGRAGIATFVMHDKEYLVAILAENGILRAETMRFHDEIRTPEEIGLPEAEEAAGAAVSRIEKEIRALAADRADETLFLDAAKKRLLELAARKQKSKADIVVAEATSEDQGESVQSLMAALQKSLSAAKGSASQKGEHAEERSTRSSRGKARKTDPRSAPRRSSSRRKKPRSRGSKPR